MRTKGFIKYFLEKELPDLVVSGKNNPIIESYLISVMRERKQEYKYSPISYDYAVELRFSADIVNKYGRRLSSGQEMKINRFLSRYIHEQINLRIWCELRICSRKGALRDAVECIVRKEMGIDDDLLETDTIIKNFQRYRKKKNLALYIYNIR